MNTHRLHVQECPILKDDSFLPVHEWCIKAKKRPTHSLKQFFDDHSWTMAPAKLMNNWTSPFNPFMNDNSQPIHEWFFFYLLRNVSLCRWKKHIIVCNNFLMIVHDWWFMNTCSWTHVKCMFMNTCKMHVHEPI